MRVFLSFHFDDHCPQDEQFVHRVAYHLARQAYLEPYCYRTDPQERNWRTPVGREVRQCDKFVLFLGRELGIVQSYEATVFLRRHESTLKRDAILVRLPEACYLPKDQDELFAYEAVTRVDSGQILDPETGRSGRGRIDESQAEQCAKGITEVFSGRELLRDPAIKAALAAKGLKDLREAWIPADGLPVTYAFDYEKVIIKEFAEGGGQLLSPRRLQEGCPQDWPAALPMPSGASYPNPVPPEEIGSYRKEEDQIIVDTRHLYHAAGNSRSCLKTLGLTFPEAGPRAQLRYPADPPGDILKVAVVVSGGIAPGINAVIDGIVMRHKLYADRHNAQNPNKQYVLEVRGYRDGFEGVMSGSFMLLTEEEAWKSEWASQGGSRIGTSRLGDLINVSTPEDRLLRSRRLDEVVDALRGIDILYVIGGDGSMKAAHALGTRALARGRDLCVMAIPKTMDNDVLWVWQAFGFLSAVEKAREFVMQLHTEASSNPRLCVMQLFGSDSGFVVSHTALATGVCKLALIPECPFNMSTVSAYIQRVLKSFRPGKGRQGPYALVLMAETAIPQDVKAYYKKKEFRLEQAEIAAIDEFIRNGWRVEGQTPTALRSAGLKIITSVLERDIRQMTPNNEYWKHYRAFANEPRHLLRAINPSVQDVIFGQRLGTLAVDNAMAGYTDFMISQWLTEYVLVPLPLVVLGRKLVPKTGIFWKSVLANTGQPRDL